MEQYDHWNWRADSSGTIWVEFDRADKTTNTINLEVLLELEHLIESLKQQAPENAEWKKLIFCSKKLNGFIAGADILDVFAQNDPAKTDLLIEKGQELFLKIEKFPLPTIALIHGFCLGGGCELALACDWRVALQSSSLNMGLPEVLLGLQPGWGGSVRLMRLIGVPAAFEMILSGKTLNASQIKRKKVADYVIPERLLNATLASITHKRPRPWFSWPWGWQWPWRLSPVRGILAFFLRSHLKKKKVSPVHYPAPWAMIANWEQVGHLTQKAFDREVRSIQALARTDTAKHLINVFRLRDQAKKSGDKSLETPKKIHVVGAGVMGGDIAYWAAAQGYHVSLSDPDLNQLHQTMKRAATWAKRRLKKASEQTAFWDRLFLDPKADALPAADLIIEAVPENLNLKKKVLADITAKARPDAIVATNTSTIPIETLAEGFLGPERLIGVHFFNPVPKMPLVEVISGTQSDSLVHQKAVSWVLGMKKLPLTVASTPGFCVNRILLPYICEGLRLMQQGEQQEVIDRSATDFGLPMGPIELADQVGLDVCAGALDSMGLTLEPDLAEKLEKLLESKSYGKKSGIGLYHYRKGKIRRNKIRDRSRLSYCQDHLLFALLNEVVQVWAENIVQSKDDIDLACVFGFGFPAFRGGPMVYIKEQGIPHLLQRFELCTRHRSTWIKEEAAWNQLAESQNQPQE